MVDDWLIWFRYQSMHFPNLYTVLLYTRSLIPLLSTDTPPVSRYPGPIFDKIRAVSNAPPYEDRVGDDDVDGKDMAYRVVAVRHLPNLK